MKLIRGSNIKLTPTAHPGILKKLLLTNGAVPGVTNLSQAAIDPGKSVEEHTHATMTEVFYVLSGEIQFYKGDEQIVAQAGDAVIIPPGTPHSLFNGNPEPCQLLYFGIAQD
jgi:quercetin dioxygenase-like cupin family protein